MGPSEYDRDCIDHQRAFPVSPNIVLLWTDAFSHSGQRCHSGKNNRYTEGNIFVVAAQEVGDVHLQSNGAAVSVAASGRASEIFCLVEVGEIKVGKGVTGAMLEDHWNKLL